MSSLCTNLLLIQDFRKITKIFHLQQARFDKIGLVAQRCLAHFIHTNFEMFFKYTSLSSDEEVRTASLSMNSR